jgi:hypothetical protein
MGLLAASEPQVASIPFTAMTRQIRNGEQIRSLAGAPPNRDGTGPNRSMADFNWCMTAIDWGWSVEDTAAKLVEVSEKASDRVRLKDVGYPLVTADHAAAAVERNRQKAGRG